MVLDCDRILKPGTRPDLDAHNGRALVAEMHVRTTELLGSVTQHSPSCHDMVPRLTGVVSVAIEVFSIATEIFWPCVSTGILCRDRV